MLGKKGEGEEQEDLLRHKVTNEELCFNKFLIEHNIPFSVADHAGKLFRKMFPDDPVANKYASAKTKASAINNKQ